MKTRRTVPSDARLDAQLRKLWQADSDEPIEKDHGRSVQKTQHLLLLVCAKFGDLCLAYFKRDPVHLRLAIDNLSVLCPDWPGTAIEDVIDDARDLMRVLEIEAAQKPAKTRRTH